MIILSFCDTFFCLIKIILNQTVGPGFIQFHLILKKKKKFKSWNDPVFEIVLMSNWKIFKIWRFGRLENFPLLTLL